MTAPTIEGFQLEQITASMEVTRGIMAAREDLAKKPTDEHAEGAIEVLEGTLVVLVEWGVELTEAMDKEYGRPPGGQLKEMRNMLHEVFQVRLVN